MRLAHGRVTSMQSVGGNESLSTLLRDPDTMRRLERIASRQLSRIAQRDPRMPRSSEDAADVVADALAEIVARLATADQVVTFDDLKREVRRQAERHRCRSGSAVEMVPLERAPEHALGREAPPPSMRRPVHVRDAATVVERIRQLAADRPRVLELLELRIEGNGRVRDRRRLGMSAREYRTTTASLEALAAVATAMPGTRVATDDPEARGN